MQGEICKKKGEAKSTLSSSMVIEHFEKLYPHEKSQRLIGSNDSPRGFVKGHLNKE